MLEDVDVLQPLIALARSPKVVPNLDADASCFSGTASL